MAEVFDANVFDSDVFDVVIVVIPGGVSRFGIGKKRIRQRMIRQNLSIPIPYRFKLLYKLVITSISEIKYTYKHLFSFQSGIIQAYKISFHFTNEISHTRINEFDIHSIIHHNLTIKSVFNSEIKRDYLEEIESVGRPLDKNIMNTIKMLKNLI